MSALDQSTILVDWRFRRGGTVMWKATVIAALLLSACSGQPSSSVSIETARQRLLDLSGQRSVVLCASNIQAMTELIDEMDFRTGMLENRKKEAIERARTSDEIDFANRMHGYDLNRALASLRGSMQEAERAIASNCPSSSRQMRAEADALRRYSSTSKALVTCAKGLDQVVDGLAKRVSGSWKSYSAAAASCWPSISAGAKADGISASPLKPSAREPSPAPQEAAASPSPSPTPTRVTLPTWTTDQPARGEESIASDLGSADAKLNSTWVSIRPRFSDEEWANLRIIQRQWMRDRDAKCGSSQKCLLDWTVARVGWLERYRPGE